VFRASSDACESLLSVESVSASDDETLGRAISLEWQVSAAATSTVKRSSAAARSEGKSAHAVAFCRTLSRPSWSWTKLKQQRDSARCDADTLSIVHTSPA